MRPGRPLLALVLVAAGVGIAIPVLSNSLHKLSAQGWFHPNATKGGLIQPATPTPETTPVTGLLQPPTPTPAPATKPATTPADAHSAEGHGGRHRGLAHRSPSHGQPSRNSAPRPASHARSVSRHRAQPGGLLPAATVRALIRAGVEIAAGIALIGLLLMALVGRRIGRRSRREYGLYELHLSTHDQAKPQDLEDMVESIANIVRAWPAERMRDGQPYLALELICGHAPHSRSGREMHWSINIRCQPRDVAALDGAISAAYPDVRLGRVHGHDPRPRAGALREPGYVMRFRKERSFVYSLIADSEPDASSPLEQIARAQIAAGAPSIVRFQLTPTPSFFEALARRRYRQHEHKIARQEHWGLPDGGLQSTFNRAEMRAAERTQNRSLFWLETVIAADSPEVCKTVAAAVQSRRGENRLHRRWMIVRQRLYRQAVPARARAADPVDAVPGVRGGGRAPARAPLRTHEGRPRQTHDAPTDSRPTRRHPRAPQTTHQHPAANPGRLRPRSRPSGAHHDHVPAGPRRPLPDAPGRQRRGPDPPLRPQVRSAADRRAGHRQDVGAARLLH